MTIKDLYSIIISNPIIIETLFHLKKYEINVIDKTKRTFIKFYPFKNIFIYFPILKDLFNDNKDIKEISYLITETLRDNSIKYEVRLNNNPLFDNFDYVYKFSFYIYLSIDISNKNKINIILKTNKNNINDHNPIINFITNYLENEHMNYIKQDIIEKELIPVLSSINHHSFELNIV
jgi:hypothetical protein